MDKDQMKVEEHYRYSVLKNEMASEVKVGKTLFRISSVFRKDGSSMKDIVSWITQRQVEKINKDAV